MGSVAGFFIDSCILLPQSLAAVREACATLLGEGVNCFVSKSIINESLQLSDEACKQLNTCLRYYIKPALERNGVTQVTRNNGKIIENVFAEQRRRLAKEAPTRTNVRGELFGIIENYIAKRIHTLDPGASISVDDLLGNARGELEKGRYEIEKPFKSITPVYVEPEEELLSLSLVKNLVHNPKDIKHLMSAIKYQFQQNAWVIFVTKDDKDVIVNEKEIWDIFGLQCTQPSWALDNYRYLTQLKRPYEYFQNILIPSEEQKQFAKALEKTMGIQILRKPFEFKHKIV